MRPVGRKERSIDFLVQYPVRGIFVSGLIAGYTKAQAFSILDSFF